MRQVNRPSGALRPFITAVDQLRSNWVIANTATSRDFEGHTAQTLGWNFGALETALDRCRHIVDRYLQVISDVNKRTFLRRWYYKRHWPLTQWLLDIRVHSADTGQDSQ